MLAKKTDSSVSVYALMLTQNQLRTKYYVYGESQYIACPTVY